MKRFLSLHLHEAESEASVYWVNEITLCADSHEFYLVKHSQEIPLCDGDVIKTTEHSFRVAIENALAELNTNAIQLETRAPVASLAESWDIFDHPLGQSELASVDALFPTAADQMDPLSFLGGSITSAKHHNDALTHISLFNSSVPNSVMALPEAHAPALTAEHNCLPQDTIFDPLSFETTGKTEGDILADLGMEAFSNSNTELLTPQYNGEFDQAFNQAEMMRLCDDALAIEEETPQSFKQKLVNFKHKLIG